MINQGEKIVILRGFEAAELILVTQGEAVGSASAPSSSSGH
jgi:hypothetical protein